MCRINMSIAAVDEPPVSVGGAASCEHLLLEAHLPSRRSFLLAATAKQSAGVPSMT